MTSAGAAWLLALVAASAAVGWALTGAVLFLLRRGAILDRPNERSSHTTPTPRGGGWGIVLTVVPAWAGLAALAGHPWPVLAVLGAAAALAAVSWIDDLRGMSQAARLAVQALAVAVGVAALPGSALVFQGLLPVIADRLATALLWLWFVNAFNFMDGIDGIAGCEAASIGAGVAVVAALAGVDPPLGWQAAVMTGAALGFLVWNWYPARVFLGDVGSVPLGFLLGWLLVGLAAAGWWEAALLLPLCFLADASLTLARRLLAGKRVWQAHREHFYQRASARLGHVGVVKLVVATNLVLIGLAAMSVFYGWTVVPLGLAAAGGLLWTLGRRAQEP